MDNKIKILTQQVVNKIAAGEVVDSPASVVKELLENSIDARANEITIEIEEGGIKKILISDNGVGMDEKDLKVSFLPHSTSKISTEDDLLKIKSFGFRGEALSSIVAVSKVTIKSRTKECSLGNEINIEGGVVKSFGEIGMPIGTIVTIEDLFYNVPARKEFLKNASTEYRSILNIINQIALAYPEISISFSNNSKNVYSLPKNHKLEDRIRIICGGDFYEKLLPVFYEHPYMEIYGFISKPELASERKKEQYIFVNKRRIHDKGISFTIKNTYGTLIPQNSYPAYCVFIDVAPNIVDVNIHPRKEEVRFSDTSLILNNLRISVKKALDNFNLTFGAKDQSMANKPAFPFGDPFLGGMAMPSMMGLPTMPINMASPMMQPPKPLIPNDKLATKDSNSLPMGVSQDKPMMAQPNFTQMLRPMTNPFWNDPYNQQPQQKANNINEATIVGEEILVIHNLYIIKQSKDGCLIYDQHALHERILYEELLNKHKDKKTMSDNQLLLSPAMISLSIEESDTFSQYKEELESLGFIIEDFGPNIYKISQVPNILANLSIKDIIHELLEDLEHDSKAKDIDSKSLKMLTYLSCKSAYKAGDKINKKEILEMIDKLEKLDNTYTCPHGRPVKIEITLDELSKKFKRS